MVQQNELRFTIYDEIEKVVSGLVSSDNITDEMPHKPEDLPAVTHTYDVSELDWNRNSAAPIGHRTEIVGYGEGGYGLLLYGGGEAVTDEIYVQLHRATFDITVSATDKATESNIHRTLKNYFQKYEKYGWDEADIDPDIFNIEVAESAEVNVPDRSPKIVAHRFELTVDFERFEDRPVDAIETITEDVS